MVFGRRGNRKESGEVSPEFWVDELEEQRQQIMVEVRRGLVDDEEIGARDWVIDWFEVNYRHGLNGKNVLCELVEMASEEWKVDKLKLDFLVKCQAEERLCNIEEGVDEKDQEELWEAMYMMASFGFEGVEWKLSKKRIVTEWDD